uniref:Uncharacterized protein n=1 Tax=Salix viminalis TaxID=40686 RepID=A0A6N2LX41_SALVM
MHSIFRTRTPLLKPRQQALLSLLDPSVIIHRTLISSSTILESESQNDDQHEKSLHLSFQEAVGLCEKTGTTNLDTHEKTNEFKIKLLELGREVRDLKEVESKKGREEKVKNVTSGATEEKPSKSLYSVFVGKSENKVEMKGREDRPKVFKGLSPDMEMFITHLYKEGYFNNASFLKDGNLDFGFFNDSYGRDFIKYAAEKFGEDHQEIAKWLSGSDLKRVCNRCVLKHSCNFVNQSVWGGDIKTLNLAAVMRVLTLYALEAAHPELSVPDEIKASVNRLLTEILSLSQTVRQAA